MTGNEYQELAGRTINRDLNQGELIRHALFGMASECGEIHSLYQHALQHDEMVDPRELRKEIGDLMWFVAELCTVYGFRMDDIMKMNIEKLRKRFPEGFSVERSVRRHEIEDSDGE